MPVFFIVAMTNGQRDIDHTQESKDKGLNDRDQGTHGIKGDWNDEFREPDEGLDDLMVPHHIAKKPQRKRDRTKAMRKGLQDKEKRYRYEKHRQQGSFSKKALGRQIGHGSKEMFDVVHALLADTDQVVSKKRHQGQTKRGVQIARRWSEPRQKAHQI